jgi:sugar lactone lactonase YvrE
LFVGDQNNHTIRKITPAGVVTTFAGAAGQAGYVDGPVAIARFNEPYFLAFDAAGNLYVSELGNHTIRKITPEGVVSTFAGGGGQFNRPIGLAFDAAGNLYVADSAQHAIRIVTPGGLVLTLAGALGNSGSNDGSATTARFYFPVGLALDAEGNIFVSDAGNDTVRKISSNGVVTTLAGAPGQKADTDGSGSVARFYQPSGICLAADGNLIVADPGNSTIRRITPAGVVTTIAGLAHQAGTADGIGAAARFFNPGHVAFDAAGALFVSDPFNHRISRGTPVPQSPK